MNDVTAPESVEDRLRTMLARRAEDMAPGDGVAWDPTATVLSLPLRPPADERRFRIRPLVAAAAAVVVVGAAALSLSTRGGDGPVTANAAAQDDGTSPASSTAPPTAPPTTPTTAAPTVPPDYDPGTPVGSYVRASDGEVVQVTWHAATTEELRAWEFPPGSEELEAGGRPANFWEGVDQEVSSLDLIFDDGILSIDGLHVGMRQDVLAFAEGVRRVTGTTEFQITPPAGYTADG